MRKTKRSKTKRRNRKHNYLGKARIKYYSIKKGGGESYSTRSKTMNSTRSKTMNSTRSKTMKAEAATKDKVAEEARKVAEAASKDKVAEEARKVAEEARELRAIRVFKANQAADYAGRAGFELKNAERQANRWRNLGTNK